ncbi:MAG: HEPN domain-containing protein [Aggregatilineales bacterium]
MAKKRKHNMQKKKWEELYPNLYRSIAKQEEENPELGKFMREHAESVFQETEEIVQALFEPLTSKELELEAELPGMSEVLHSLTLYEPENASVYEQIVLVHENEINITRHEKNQLINISRLVLWYKEIPKISIDDLRGFIEEKLRERNHPSNRSITENFLALFALTLSPGRSPIKHLQELFELILPTKITIFYILPIDSVPRLPKCTFGPYSYGELPLRELRRLDRISGTNLLKQYGHLIEGNMTITRHMPDIQLIDWVPLLNKHIEKNIPSWVVSGWAVDTYYNKVNELLFEMFFEEMLKYQHLTIALGSQYIDPDNYRNQKDVITIVANEYSRIGNNKPKGLLSSRLHLNLKFIDPAIFDIPSYNEQLKEKYNFTDYKDTPLHHTLQTYSQFIARAKILEDKHKPSEAFLQYVIALELVFAGKETISPTIAKRVAAITCKQTNCDFEFLRHRIREDYRLRSFYVHEGQSISSEQLASIAEICHYVLHAILYLQQAFPQISVDTWMENIDLLASKLSNSEQPDDELFRSCGAVYPS